MDDRIHLRTVTPEELPDLIEPIYRLDRACLGDSAEARRKILERGLGDPDEAQTVSVAMREEQLVGACFGGSDSSVFTEQDLLQDLEGRLVPAHEVEIVSPARSLKYHAGTPNAHISLVAVDETQRGRGVASGLLHTFLKARQEQQFSLHVDPSNHTAIALYRQVGFLEAARRDKDGFLLYWGARTTLESILASRLKQHGAVEWPKTGHVLGSRAGAVVTPDPPPWQRHAPHMHPMRSRRQAPGLELTAGPATPSRRSLPR